MCGICGITIPFHESREVSEAALRRMRETLTHRGPDDAGFYMARNVGLGHRRLSIVDVGGGHQPMPNEDGTVWIAFNGEIYNHRELRPALEQKGHRYKTASDTETILHLYEEEGALGVAKLRGMFAYAIWDSVKGKLLLARDRLGIKPLYYILKEDGSLYFASEIKALLEGEAVSPELNFSALGEFAANRYTSGDQTLFKGIQRLPPGHVLEWEDGKATLTSYWGLDFNKPAPLLTERQYVSGFLDLFRECVRTHLMADVPLGVFLSGGIDSSAIAAVMSQFVKGPIKTFSVAFAEREANELEYAKVVAEAFHTDHHEIVVSPQQFFDALPTLVYQEDEPIAHPSSIPLFFLSRLAAQHVKVVLTGEGSDELLAGYNKYRVTVYNMMLGKQYDRFVPAPIRGLIERTIQDRGAAPGIWRALSRTFLALPPDLRRLYFDNFAVYPAAMHTDLFSDTTREQIQDSDPYRIAMRYSKQPGADTLLDQLLAVDLKSYLHELLMKQDQMSMAASIESRVPFLDHKLVEFATRLPIDMKLRGATTKYVLRKAMADVLPERILNRKKMGFPVPVGNWFRGEFRSIVDEYVLSERVRARGLFNHEFVRTLVSRHNAGENHTERIWMLLNIEIWFRRFFDGEQAPLMDMPGKGGR
ncbi:MAG: asparagine synthase (glutamine-hydrolyzing) [Nitrospiraceae bacterium]|nr:asparagine synthase (glutamine-hydrolyzing) [Nitrospiraceae bacterium]